MGRQEKLAGEEFEDKKVPVEVRRAAEAAREKRLERIEIQKEEKLLVDRLIDLMEKHGVPRFIDREADPVFEAKLTKGKTKVTLRAITESSADEEEAEEAAE